MELTHIDPAGNAVMVDVGEKPATRRTAVAEGFITMSPHCFAVIAAGHAKKGDVLGVAQVAGIMATKHTADLIPLCHRLNLTKSAVTFELLEDRHAHPGGVHRPVRGPHRRGDGSPHRGVHGAAHRLRYGQGAGPGHAD